MFYAQSYSRKNGKTLIVATLAISMSVIAHANTVQSPSVAPSVTGLSSNKPVTVYFMNGINNSEVQAQTSTIALFNRLKEIPKFSNLVNNKQVSLRTLYNPSSPLLGDVYELDAQASIQKTALLATDNRIKTETIGVNYNAQDYETLKRAIFNEEIFRANQTYKAKKFSVFNFISKAGKRSISEYEQLGNEIRGAIVNGEKVILVTHSQGNYLAQGIYGNLYQDPTIGSNLAKNLHVVGVANVAGTTPSGEYITVANDNAVYFAHGYVQGGNPMLSNFNARFANGEPLDGFWESKAQRQNDTMNHGFIETYLSARINDDSELVPHSPAIVADEVDTATGEYKTIYSSILEKVNRGLDKLFA